MQEIKDQIKANASALKLGETGVVGIRGVINGKVELQFSERIKGLPSSNNVLAMFNKSDENFTFGGVTNAWMCVVPEDAHELLGDQLGDLDLRVLKEGDMLACNILNPHVEDERLRVQIQETNTPSEYDAKNVLKRCKQIKDSKTGEVQYFLADGKPIFAYTKVVLYPDNFKFDKYELVSTMGDKVAMDTPAVPANAVSTETPA